MDSLVEDLVSEVCFEAHRWLKTNRVCMNCQINNSSTGISSIMHSPRIGVLLFLLEAFVDENRFDVFGKPNGAPLSDQFTCPNPNCAKYADSIYS